MRIISTAAAGTLESSDAYVRVEPAEELVIEIESVVYNQFGDQIREAIHDILYELNVDAGRIFVNDRGALDCVIKARVEAAVKRAGGEE